MNIRYYYEHMNKIQQEAYHAIRKGLMELAPSFAVPRLEQHELSDIFFKLRLDCPEIFYATGFRYKFYAEASNVEFIPQYLFDKGKIKEHQAAMEGRINRLARQIQELKTEADKEKFIHDFICTQVHYDKLKKPYSHEIIGPLGHGVGVCEGMAKTVKVLCDRVGIWCIIAISEACPEKDIKYRHAWNVIKVGGQYYHLDTTFDNTVSKCGVLRYDYFNLPDKYIYRDHEPVITRVTECNNSEHFYYKEKKISFTKIEDVEKRAAQAVKKKKPFLFHWRGGYLTKEVLGELLNILERAAREKERHARISLNLAQAVIMADFLETAATNDIIMENVDESQSD